MHVVAGCVPLDCTLGRLIASSTLLLEFAKVVDAGHALEPGLLVQERVDVTDGHPELVVQERVQSRIDIAGAGAHHQTLEWCQTHRRLDGNATAYRRRRAAIPQMQHDLIQLATITANQLRRGPRYVTMRRAMEAIATNPILLAKITRDRIRCGSQRQGAEEGSIEDRNMRYVELGLRRLDAGHGPRIVQWRKGNEVLDLVEHVVIDDGRG